MTAAYVRIDKRDYFVDTLHVPARRKEIDDPRTTLCSEGFESGSRTMGPWVGALSSKIRRNPYGCSN
jgi:hypothetical protein